MARGQKAGLLFLAFAIAVIVLLVVRELVSPEALEEQRFLFPEVGAGYNAIESIQIKDNNFTVKLVHQNSAWRIGAGTSAEGYEVDVPMIAGLIRFVKNAKYLDQKTNQKDKLAKLGLAIDDSVNLDSVGAEAHNTSATPTLLTIKFPGREEAVLIGNQSRSGLGTYIRFPNTLQAWLVSGEVNLPVDVVAWVPRVFLDIDRAEIERAEFRSATGELVIISADSETESAMIENLPLGASLAYESVGDMALSALVNLRLEALAQADQFSFQAVDTAKFELVSGEIILIRCLELQNEFWISISRGNIIDQWAYRIDRHRYNQLTRRMRDYLAPEQ